MEFAYDGGGIGKGGEVTLYVDGKAVGSGRVERTEALILSCDETLDVGRESGSRVTKDNPVSKFNQLASRTAPTCSRRSRCCTGNWMRLSSLGAGRIMRLALGPWFYALAQVPGASVHPIPAALTELHGLG